MIFILVDKMEGEIFCNILTIKIAPVKIIAPKTKELIRLNSAC
jgi:hypothetical protein